MRTETNAKNTKSNDDSGEFIGTIICVISLLYSEIGPVVFTILVVVLLFSFSILVTTNHEVLPAIDASGSSFIGFCFGIVVFTLLTVVMLGILTVIIV